MLNNGQKAAALHRDARSCSELAPWLTPYNDRVIINKDACLMACFSFEGIDTDSATIGELNSQAEITEFASKVFSDKPITIWWKVDRKRTRYYPGGTFPDPISQSIDDSRRKLFESGNNRVNKHTLTICLHPATGSDRFLARMQRLMMLEEGLSYWKAGLEALKTFVSDNKAFAYAEDELHTAAARFEEALTAFVGSFSAKVHYRRLEGDELGAFLSNATTGNTHEQEAVALPKRSWFLDSYLPAAYVIPGHNFLEFGGFGQTFARIVTIKAFPEPVGEDKTGFSVPGQLDKLLSVEGDISFSQAFRFAGKEKSIKYMQRVNRFNDIAKAGWKGILAGAIKGSMDGVKVNSGRERDIKQTDDAIGRLTVDQLVSGWYNCTVVCYGDTLDEVDELVKKVESIVRSARFIPNAEKEHSLSAWAGTMPGQWGEIVRWHFTDTANMANLAPLRTISRGQIRNEFLTEHLGVECPPLAALPTDYGTPFYFVHVIMAIGHMLFMGPSRTGKTVMANFLWTMFRKYLRARVIIFDIDHSTRVPVLLQGGSYIDFSDETDERPKSNPLVLLEDPRHLGYLVRFIKMLCEMRGYKVQANQETAIENALLATKSLGRSKWRLLSVFAQITDPALKEQLSLWVGDRPYARYFDNVEDNFDLTNLLAMETRTILKDEIVAVPFMDLAFYRIQAQMADEREQGLIVPTVIYCPEVWYFLKNERFANQLENYLKTFARYAANLWMDTQSPDELLKSGIFGALRDQLKTIIFTPNKNALSETLYKMFSSDFLLSDAQIRKIAGGRAQQDYFIKQEDMSRMVRPGFDRETLAKLASDGRTRATFDRHYKKGQPTDPDWRQNFIDEMMASKKEKEAA